MGVNGSENAQSGSKVKAHAGSGVQASNSAQANTSQASVANKKPFEQYDDDAKAAIMTAIIAASEELGHDNIKVVNVKFVS